VTRPCALPLATMYLDPVFSTFISMSLKSSDTRVHLT
jgi:hypothetical protein